MNYHIELKISNISFYMIITIKQRMEAVPNTKDKKIVNNRKKQGRQSQQLQPHHLICSQSKCQGIKIQEETLEEQKNMLQMTNIALFHLKTKHHSLQYPSSFALIKDSSHLSHNNVTIDDLKHPCFPVLSYKIKQLIRFTCSILQTNPYAQHLYPQSTLESLITIIAQHYNSVSYHNFSHAFNLMLINYQCIERQQALKKLYSEEEIFYIIIAAISHDLAHRGTNNQFEIKNHSELAKISNNQSVLENMHVRTLWKILAQNPHLNFLSLAKDEKKAKHIITRLILNTDMAFHFSNLQKLKCLKSSKSLTLNSDNDHKWVVMEQIFHASDIGNPCLDYDSYLSWAALLTYEFDQQARLQQKLGIQITRAFIYKDMNSLYADQQWFLGSIVQPLWKELSDIFPGLNIFHENVSSNLKKIKEQILALSLQ